jgi:hypothetical protein
MDRDENTPWQYKPDAKSSKRDPDNAESPEVASKNRTSRTVNWEAMEFIDHPRGAGWYALLILGTLALATVVYLLAKDAVAAVIIVMLGIIIGIFATQKPKTVKYEISDSGLSIDGKSYNIANYKSFAVIREGDLVSINLFPLKRLMPPLSAYFDPKDEKKITEVLGEYLPYENRQLDSIERLARRLRL